MKQLLHILFLAALPLLGNTQQTFSDSILLDTVYRSYVQYVPANYTGSSEVPMVFYFHAYGSSAHSHVAYDLRLIADTAGFIVVQPQGLLNKDTVTHWNVGEWIGDSIDDVGFVSVLIDSIALDYNIDLSRVYSTGMSNGGFMSFHLACQLSEKIAAIASVSGSMTFHTFNNCNPERPVPILQIHGTYDSAAHHEGNSWSKAVTDVAEYWANYNNCNPQPVETSLPDVDDTNGVTIDYIVYAECDDNVSVEYFKIIGGLHTWNGLDWGVPNYDFNTSLEIWKFFSKYELNQSVDSVVTDLMFINNQSVRVYPNPAQTKITLELNDDSMVINDERQGVIEIYNSLGQLVQWEEFNNLKQSTLNINIAGLENGVYVLRIDNAAVKFNVLK